MGAETDDQGSNPEYNVMTVHDYMWEGEEEEGNVEEDVNNNTEAGHSKKPKGENADDVHPSTKIIIVNLERETEFLPKDDYLNRLRNGDLDLNVRREAVDWISKAHMHFGFGELSFCLSINYLDRFLSLYQLRRNTWIGQLLAVACLSLAAKMEEINVPMAVDLQVGNPTHVFEGKSIQRMELLVLNVLQRRMQACTPCTFIDYFVRKLNGDHVPTRPLITRSMQLILSAIRGIDFLEFRPSEIAAAVAMSVSGETQANDIDKALPFLFKHIQKERVMQCVAVIQDVTLVNGTMTITDNASASSSPNGV